mgnify:CR=1 FL=1
MSRIGKLPITIPAGVDFKLDGQVVTVKGPKGTLSRELHKDMIIKVENGVVTVERPSDKKEHRSLHGLTRTLISNMVIGMRKFHTHKSKSPTQMHNFVPEPDSISFLNKFTFYFSNLFLYSEGV